MAPSPTPCFPSSVDSKDAYVAPKLCKMWHLALLCYVFMFAEPLRQSGDWRSQLGENKKGGRKATTAGKKNPHSYLQARVPDDIRRVKQLCMCINHGP